MIALAAIVVIGGLRIPGGSAKNLFQDIGKRYQQSTEDDILSWRPRKAVAVKRFLMQEHGQGIVEYCLVIVLVAGVLVMLLSQIGDTTNGIMTTVSGELVAGT